MFLLVRLNCLLNVVFYKTVQAVSYSDFTMVKGLLQQLISVYMYIYIILVHYSLFDFTVQYH